MNIQDKIINELKNIEMKKNVKILFACESGSRAWGFPSTNSDYDVRFIYIQPVNNYLSINEKRETIELPIVDELDINGWDIKKTLRLLAKSNAVVFEWLKSPIIYRKIDDFYKTLFDIANEYFSPRSSIYHYIGITKKYFLTIKDMEKFKIKKYFYVLRPLLAVLWIKNYQKMPPMEFQELLKLPEIDKNVLDNINQLLIKKDKEEESYEITSIKIIDDFVEKHISECETLAKEMDVNSFDIEPLNILFRKLI